MPKNRKEMVKMEEFKERMQQEYAQLKERWEKLKKFNNSKEILRHLDTSPCTGTAEERAREREETLRCDLMHRQQSVMGEYLHLLELRAELEGIEL